METLSKEYRDRGREQERVMVRISIPQCWCAARQSLRDMGLGMERGEARGREALLGGRQGWKGEGVRERGCSVAAESPPACLLRSTSD